MSAVGVAEALWEGAGARWAEQKNSNGRGPSSADRPGGRGYGAVGVASAGPSGAALGWDRPPSLESESARDAPGRAPGLSAQKFPARAPGGRAAGSGRRAGRPLPPPGLARGRGVGAGAPPRPPAGDKARAPAGPSEICRPEEPALQAGAPGDPRKNWAGWLNAGCSCPASAGVPPRPSCAPQARGAEAGPLLPHGPAGPSPGSRDRASVSPSAERGELSPAGPDPDPRGGSARPGTPSPAGRDTRALTPERQRGPRRRIPGSALGPR